MALANCPRCGALFNKITRDICPNCFDEEEQLLRDTQDYLRDHRNASKVEILDAVEDLNISLLDRWVNDGRIHLLTSEEESTKVRCVYCGREVTGGGKICKTCQIKKTLSQKQNQLSEQAETQSDKNKQRIGGMHFKRK